MTKKPFAWICLLILVASMLACLTALITQCIGGLQNGF